MNITRNSIGQNPVTVEEARRHLRLGDDSFDELLASLLDAAIDHAENITGLILREGSQYTVVAPYATSVRTGLLPIRSVAVRVDDQAEPSYTLTGSTITLPGRYDARVVEIEVETGFDVFPGAIRAAILLIVGKLFANPNDGVENLPSASLNLLKNYRIWDQ